MFRELPEQVRKVLREQLSAAARLNYASGIPMVECRKMILCAGGMDDLVAAINTLKPGDEFPNWEDLDL